MPIFLPPLRERRSDVDMLALEFLRRFNQEHGVSLSLSKSAMDAIRACDFPGNVRELESCVRRTAALAKDSSIVIEDLACSNGSCLSLVLGKSMNKWRSQDTGYIPLPVLPVAAEGYRVSRTPGDVASFSRPTDAQRNGTANGASSGGDDAVERERLIAAMERSGWVQAKAARVLGLTPRQMGYALRKHKVADQAILNRFEPL